MELFTYTSTPALSMQNAVPIDNYNTATWIERYRDPGEFKIEAPLSSGLRSLLPIGSIVSHVDTAEFCIVENQEISEAKSSDPTITISGRSFDSFLESRVVGGGMTYANSTPPWEEYSVASGYSHLQAIELLDDHLITTSDPNDSLSSYLGLWHTGLPSAGAVIQDIRYLARGSVHQSFMDILNIDDIGVRCYRPNDWSAIPGTISRLVLHKGYDKSDSVIFSWISGELESVSYLFSNKALKNTAVVQGRWIEKYVYTAGATGYDRRSIYVDGSDIDSKYETLPTGTDLTDVESALIVRGQEVLAKYNEVNIVAADISKLNRYKYRVDYDIGDIVSIDGSYGDIERRRVIEHVEIEDVNGATSYPTLALIED